MTYHGGGRGGGRGGGGRRGGGGGRGAYYREKYGGGSRGGGGGGGGRGRRDLDNGGGGGGRGSGPKSTGGSYNDLKQILGRIDGRQYPAYHDLETAVNCSWLHPDGFGLCVGRAQSDPFAPPTRCRVQIPSTVANLPGVLYQNSKIRRIATADYLWRQLYDKCRSTGADNTIRSSGGGGGGGGGWSGPKGGDVQVMPTVQHVIEQSAVQIDARGNVIAQVTINLPARGRTVLGGQAEHILDVVLSRLVRESLLYSAVDSAAILAHVESVEDQAWLQDQLDGAGLVAFVRNGAILPRLSGVDDRPMMAASADRGGGAVPFRSPPSLETSFTLPNSGQVMTGMGIKKGITLICGGGFHGKSTLLQTLQLGVYLKIPGDGREFCLCSKNAAKIRAEDGRYCQAVDISPFINNLPFGRDTTSFTTLDASGSTSQATNIVEALEVGADTLLIDEDTCATNFMIRDNKMMQLVAADKEPITPFVRVVRSLYTDRGISTILVVGGAGDYFDVADYVLLMDCYRCEDATARAKEIVLANNSQANNAAAPDAMTVAFPLIRERTVPARRKFSPDGKVKVKGVGVISYGDTEIDLSALEVLVSTSQTSAVAEALKRFASSSSAASATGSGSTSESIRSSLQILDGEIERGGLEVLAPGQFNGGLIRPRLLEIAGAVNRLRRDNSISQV